MGYYIPNDRDIELRPNAEQISEPSTLEDVSKDEAIICAIDNGLFRAYGYAYSQKELEVFKIPDNRSKKWFKMPLKEAQKLSGYNRFKDI